MKYLCDMNIAMQILRRRLYSGQCERFFYEHIHETAITDFSLFSFCIRASQFGIELPAEELMTSLLQRGLRVLTTEPVTSLSILAGKVSSPLDFDDYLQYRVAKDHHLALVTLDKDFFRKKLDIRVLRPDQVT